MTHVPVPVPDKSWTFGQYATYYKMLNQQQQDSCNLNAILYKQLLNEKADTVERCKEFVEGGKTQINLFMKFHWFRFGPALKMTHEQKDTMRQDLKELMQKYNPCVQKILKDYYNTTFCKEQESS